MSQYGSDLSTPRVGWDQSFLRRHHVARPKDTRKVPHTTIVASSLKQGLCRAQRIGHPDYSERAARRLRRGVEGVWRGFSERLSGYGGGPGPCQIRKLHTIFVLPSKLKFERCWWPGRACVLLLYYYVIPTRHHQRSSMAHWRGREKHTCISEVYPRQREAR
jgi:hypothetical protein